MLGEKYLRNGSTNDMVEVQELAMHGCQFPLAKNAITTNEAQRALCLP